MLQTRLSWGVGWGQQVNAIQSNAFISLMEIITAYRDGEEAAAGKHENMELLSVSKASEAGRHGRERTFLRDD